MIHKLFSLFLFISCLTVFAQQPPPKLPLDGKKFTVEIIQEGKKKPFDPDDISFNMGKLKDGLFSDDSWGFSKAGKYTITGIDSVTTPNVKVYSWTVDLLNDKGEKLAWSGSMTGETIEGTIEYINKKGVTKNNFTFTGQLKTKPGGHK